MVDLFGLPDPTPTARKPKPVARPAVAAPAPVADAERPETGPRFGTPEWDRCKCGGWATLHFPNAGGVRRCLRHAIAEGRFELTPFPRWGFKASDAAGSDAGDTTRGPA